MADTAAAMLTPMGSVEERDTAEDLRAEIARLKKNARIARAEIERLEAADGEAEVPAGRLYRLTVEQYHAMSRAEILTEKDSVELLEGWLVRKMTKHPPHAVSTVLVREALHFILPSGWFVNTQDPITTVDSEPEPDVFVVRGGVRDYQERHPGPTELALVVEVADRSLSLDRGKKKRLYARARIVTYWIVNLNERQIEVYTHPVGSGRRADFRQRRDYGPDDRIPVVIDDVEVAALSVAELLP